MHFLTANGKQIALNVNHKHVLTQMVSNSVIETAFSFVINLVFTNAENGCGIARMDTASAIMMTKAAVFCLIAAATFGYPSGEQKLILQDLARILQKS